MQHINSLSTPWIVDKTNIFYQITLDQVGYQSKIQVKFSPQEITIEQLFRSNLRALSENILPKWFENHFIEKISFKISSPFTEEQKALIKEILESQNTITLLEDSKVKTYNADTFSAMIYDSAIIITYDTRALWSVSDNVKKCCQELSKFPSGEKC